MCTVCPSTAVVILCCGVFTCWDLSSEYRSYSFFDLPIKRVKAEHIVRDIPLGLFVRGLGCSNLILCIYADLCDECCCCVVAVLCSKSFTSVAHKEKCATAISKQKILKDLLRV
jgi:hypothetical protein